MSDKRKDIPKRVNISSLVFTNFYKRFICQCWWAVSTWEMWALQNDDDEVLHRGQGPEYVWQHLCFVLPPQTPPRNYTHCLLSPWSKWLSLPLSFYLIKLVFSIWSWINEVPSQLDCKLVEEDKEHSSLENLIFFV